MKTTIKYHLKPVRMTKIQKHKKGASVGEDVVKKGTLMQY